MSRELPPGWTIGLFASPPRTHFPATPPPDSQSIITTHRTKYPIYTYINITPYSRTYFRRGAKVGTRLTCLPSARLGWSRSTKRACEPLGPIYRQKQKTKPPTQPIVQLPASQPQRRSATINTRYSYVQAQLQVNPPLLAPPPPTPKITAGRSS